MRCIPVNNYIENALNIIVLHRYIRFNLMYFNDSATEKSSVEYKTKLYNANNKKRNINGKIK